MVKEKDSFYEQHNALIQHGIIDNGIEDKNVIIAMRKVERHVFIPDEDKNLAYWNIPLPIGNKQTISQPYIVAYMIEKLCLNKNSKVLEIGAGSGYAAAILGEIVKEVYGVEIIPSLAKNAAKTLKKLKYNNISIKIGNGFLGWTEKAPFDAILVSCAVDEIPKMLVAQLKIKGKMILPLSEPIQGNQYLWLIEKESDNNIIKKRFVEVRFVPMVNKI